MQLTEAIELLKVVSEIPVKNVAKHPEIRIFHEVGEGYTLRIKAKSVNADYREHLVKIAESSNLRIRESKRYIIICDNP